MAEVRQTAVTKTSSDPGLTTVEPIMFRMYQNFVDEYCQTKF